MTGGLDWRVAAGLELGGGAHDPLAGEPDPEELEARAELGSVWQEAEKTARALEGARRRRPVICLMDGVWLCGSQPWPALSPCLRPVDHAGGHVYARRLPDGWTVEFYVVAGQDQPDKVLVLRLHFAEPTRVELAELWAWHEETTTQGREAVGR